jgi:hypothetical protein
MAAFPTLSKKPEKDSYRKQRLYDSTQRAEYENGVPIERARHTRVPWQWWFTYHDLPQSDVNLLETFEGTTVKMGAVAFDWTDPVTGTSCKAKLLEPLDIQLEPDGATLYQVSVHIREAPEAV